MSDQWTKVSQRTVKCDRCGVRDFYWYLNADDGTQQLRERDGVTVHNCHITVSAPRAPRLASQAAREDVPEIAADMDRGQLIPSKAIFDAYLPRKLNGITDLEALSKAFDVTEAHMEGRCLDECPPQCKRLPKNVVLIGDAGTGKNHLPEALAYMKGLPLASISLNGGTTVEDLIGQPYFIGGNTVWVDGLLTDFVRNGGIVILDEINACPQEIAFVLHQILDWRRTLSLVQKGREIITAHPRFFVVATMNPDYRGTKPLNQAFKDRFSIPIELDYDESIEKKLLRREGMDEDKIEKMIGLAKHLRKSYRSDELETPCSTRMLLDYAGNTRLLGEHIARDCFIARFSQSEQAAVREAMGMAVDQGQIIDVSKDVNLVN